VHTRFPVAQGSLDHVIGVVESKDLLAQCLAGGPIDLSSVLHQVEFIPESMKALEALSAFEHSGLQIALVMDEYAGLQGLVTTYDVFEALVGELPAHPAKVSTAQRRDDGSWLIDGMLATEEFKDLLDLPDLPAEERAVYETVGGLVMTLLGHVPVEGDKVEWRGLTLEVVDMDDKRVDKVLVIPPARRLT
jgi:putative hemolysin